MVTDESTKVQKNTDFTYYLRFFYYICSIKWNNL